jgi:hypothetical protein
MTLGFAPASQCSEWQNKQFDPLVIIPSFMTMSGMQTLPCMNVNKRLQPILDIYGMPVTTQGKSFDCNCFSSSMPICQPDLSPLIRSIGFYHEGCLLSRKSTNSNCPDFLCNNCRLFKGSFVASDYSSKHTSNQFYFDVTQSTTDRGLVAWTALVVRWQSPETM